MGFSLVLLNIISRASGSDTPFHARLMRTAHVYIHVYTLEGPRKVTSVSKQQDTDIPIHPTVCCHYSLKRKDLTNRVDRSSLHPLGERRASEFVVEENMKWCNDYADMMSLTSERSIKQTLKLALAFSPYN